MTPKQSFAGTDQVQTKTALSLHAVEISETRDKRNSGHWTTKGSSRCKTSVADPPILASTPGRDLTMCQPLSFTNLKTRSQDFKGQEDFLPLDRSKACVADIGLTISKRDIGWEAPHYRWCAFCDTRRGPIVLAA